MFELIKAYFEALGVLEATYRRTKSVIETASAKEFAVALKEHQATQELCIQAMRNIWSHESARNPRWFFNDSKSVFGSFGHYSEMISRIYKSA